MMRHFAHSRPSLNSGGLQLARLGVEASELRTKLVLMDDDDPNWDAVSEQLYAIHLRIEVESFLLLAEARLRKPTTEEVN